VLSKPVTVDPTLLNDVPVLIVDDNATNRHILEATLTHWRMKPVLASCAADALCLLDDARATGKPFRLMIVDCHMPDVGGFMLVEEIRKIPKLQGLMTMMLTSGGQRGDGARCKELGIGAYLTKPALQSDLLYALLRIVGASSSEVKPTQPVTRHTLRQGRRNLRILLAEDNSINQRLASRLLEKEGHLVVVASDGVKGYTGSCHAKALEAIARESFDLILMDV
jgi:two-component system sensor histidine kinase/response regulator